MFGPTKVFYTLASHWPQRKVGPPIKVLSWIPEGCPDHHYPPRPDSTHQPQMSKSSESSKKPLHIFLKGVKSLDEQQKTNTGGLKRVLPRHIRKRTFSSERVNHNALHTSKYTWALRKGEEREARVREIMIFLPFKAMQIVAVEKQSWASAHTHTNTHSSTMSDNDK